MFINFGKGKCPLCGANGKKTSDLEIFLCPRCRVRFHPFGLIDTEPEKIYESLSQVDEMN
ncbi:MAG: hypothetical protein DRP08_00750 [Candidatus Aenigmatarchaeota archaeon]|nr:hypothetical protein [Candidatus Aenigmarchaeota archaeon]RLJ04819.1 MAG: hypothetical protein DRP08_00750 [Candidatus Aenigmarchaeota archaeon]